MVGTHVARWLGAAATLFGFAPVAAAGFPVIRLWPDTNPPCDTTLQACIDASGPGDQIRVATDGPIPESLSYAIPLSLVAQDGYHPVLTGIDGDGLTIRASSSGGGDETIRIDGLSLASGVYVQPGSAGTATVEIANDTFASGTGIAIAPQGSGPATIQVTNDTLVDAGGIGIDTNVPGTGPISFVVSHNQLASPSTGGSGSARIVVSVSTTTATGSIADNVIEPGDDPAPAILIGAGAAVDVIRNHIAGGSPGIELDAAASGTSARILGNLLVGRRGQPGALQVDGIDAYTYGTGAVSATIDDNTIANFASGVRVDNFAAQAPANACEIENNAITGNGVGVNASACDSPYWGTNLYFGNVANGNGFNGGVFADPLYVSDSDFHLKPGSPAIDTGEDLGVPNDLLTDLDGNPRIRGAHVDFGVYEAPESSRAVGESASLAALLVLGLVRRSSDDTPRT